MTPEDEWNAIRAERTPLFGLAGMGMLRIALLFGLAAVALGLILAPMADKYSRPQITGAGGFDTIATGAIGSARRLHDPQERAAGDARVRLHHPRQRPAQRRLLTSLPVVPDRRDRSRPVNAVALTFLNGTALTFLNEWTLGSVTKGWKTTCT